jgi:hypothetical protein
MKLPWEPIDPHGDGILARIVHDAGMGHVGVFDTAEQARAVCETMNRAAGVEAERSELAAEVARLGGPSPDECSAGGDCIESITHPGFCARCEREMPRRVPGEADPEALQKRIEKAVAVLSTGQCRNCCPEALRFLRG